MADDETREENVADIDFSQIRTAIQLGGRTIEQILNGIHYGTPEVRLLLLDECDIILECRVCRGLFRALANFVAHKRVYCKQAYIMTQQELFNNFTDDEVLVVEPTAPEDDVDDNVEMSSEAEAPKSADERVQETISQINDGVLGTSQMYQLYSRAAEKVDRQKKTKKTLSAVLSKIASNPNAVRVSYQEVDEETLAKMESAPKPGKVSSSREKAVPTRREVAAVKGVDDTSSVQSETPKSKSCLETMLLGIQPGAKSVERQTASASPSPPKQGKKPDVKETVGKKTSPSSTAVKASLPPPKVVIVSSKGTPNSPSKATQNPPAKVLQTSARRLALMEKVKLRDEKPEVDTEEMEKDHSDSIVDLSSLTCLQCNTKYSSRKTLLYHVQMRHSGLRTFFPCPYCVNVFFYFWGLTRHLQHHHKKSPHQINKMRRDLRDAAFTKSVTKQCMQAKDQLEYTAELEPMSEDGTSPDKPVEVDTPEKAVSASGGEVTTAVVRPRSGRHVTVVKVVGKVESPAVPVKNVVGKVDGAVKKVVGKVESPVIVGKVESAAISLKKVVGKVENTTVSLKKAVGKIENPIPVKKVMGKVDSPITVPVKQIPGEITPVSRTVPAQPQLEKMTSDLSYKPQKVSSKPLLGPSDVNVMSPPGPAQKLGGGKPLIKMTPIRKMNKATVKHTPATINYTFASRYVPPADEADVSTVSEEDMSCKQTPLKQKFTHQLACDKCEKVFWKKDRLTNHKKYCSASKFSTTAIQPFVCLLCTKTFSRERSLNSHFAYCKRRHDSEEKTYLYSCSNCDRTFEKKTGLENHRRACLRTVAPTGGDFKKPTIKDVVKDDPDVTKGEGSQREVTDDSEIPTEHAVTRRRTRTSSVDSNVEQLRLRRRTGRDSSEESTPDHSRTRRQTRGASDGEESRARSTGSGDRTDLEEEEEMDEEELEEDEDIRVVEEIWVQKQPGRPSEKVKSNRIYVMEADSVGRLHCQDTKKLSAIVDEVKLRCIKCGQDFTSVSNLRRHAIRHLGWKRYKCKLCRFSSYNRSECNTHIVRTHSEKYRFTSAESLIVDLNKEASRIRSKRKQDTMCENQAAVKQEDSDAPCAKKRRQAKESGDEDDGDVDLTRKFNISTRNSPRKFDTRPYKRLDNLSTLETRKGYYPKPKLKVKGTSEDGAVSDSATPVQRKMDIVDEAPGNVRESQSVSKHAEPVVPEGSGRRSSSADSNKTVESVHSSDACSKKSKQSNLGGSMSDLSDTGSTEVVESDYGRGKRKPKLSALMTLFRDSSIAKETDKAKAAAAKASAKGKCSGASECESQATKPAENASTETKPTEKTNEETKCTEKDLDAGKASGKKVSGSAGAADKEKTKDKTVNKDKPATKSKTDDKDQTSDKDEIADKDETADKDQTADKDSSDKEDSPSQKKKHSSDGDKSPEFLAPWPRAQEPMSVQEMFELIRTPSASTGGPGRRKSTGDASTSETSPATKKTTTRLSVGNSKTPVAVKSGDGKAKLGATLTRRSGAAVSLSLRTSRPGVDWSQNAEDVQEMGTCGGESCTVELHDVKPRLRSDNSVSVSQNISSVQDVKPRLRSDSVSSEVVVAKAEPSKQS